MLAVFRHALQDILNAGINHDTKVTTAERVIVLAKVRLLPIVKRPPMKLRASLILLCGVAVLASTSNALARGGAFVSGHFAFQSRPFVDHRFFDHRFFVPRRYFVDRRLAVAGPVFVAPPVFVPPPVVVVPPVAPAVFRPFP
jgi:hypothetical protein